MKYKNIIIFVMCIVCIICVIILFFDIRRVITHEGKLAVADVTPSDNQHIAEDDANSECTSVITPEPIATPVNDDGNDSAQEFTQITKRSPIVIDYSLLSDEDKNIVNEINTRVNWIDDIILLTGGDFYSDHYERDMLMHRSLVDGSDEDESLVFISLYYNEEGKLIYADIIHYRGPFYFMYFVDDDFYFLFDLSDIYKLDDLDAIIDTSDHYRYVLDDIAICLDNRQE